MKRTYQKPIITARTFERLQDAKGVKLHCLSCGTLTPLSVVKPWKGIKSDELRKVKELNRTYEVNAMSRHESECQVKTVL